MKTYLNVTALMHVQGTINLIIMYNYFNDMIMLMINLLHNDRNIQPFKNVCSTFLALSGNLWVITFLTYVYQVVIPTLPRWLLYAEKISGSVLSSQKFPFLPEHLM